MWKEEDRDSNFLSKKHLKLNPDYLMLLSAKPSSSPIFLNIFLSFCDFIFKFTSFVLQYSLIPSDE